MILNKYALAQGIIDTIGERADLTACEDGTYETIVNYLGPWYVQFQKIGDRVHLIQLEEAVCSTLTPKPADSVGQ